MSENRATVARGDAEPPTQRKEILNEDTHVHLLLSLEYHGTNYGGWQRQGPNNHINYPSIQGTLEKAATKACLSYCSKSLLIPTNEEGDCGARLSASSGRTDRGVHALDHRCILRLPFSSSMLLTDNNPQQQQSMREFLMGPSLSHTTSTPSSPFLTVLNQALPSDVHVRTCRIITNKQERKRIRFVRKRYTYLIQQAPLNRNRPWNPWNDYTYFVPWTLDLSQIREALTYMQGRHNFLPLSCEKGKSLPMMRTFYRATVSTVTNEQLPTLPWFHRAFRQPEERNREKRKRDCSGKNKKKGRVKQQQQEEKDDTRNNSSPAEPPRPPPTTATGRKDVNPVTTNYYESIFAPPIYGAPLNNDNSDARQVPKVQKEENGNQLQHDHTIIQIEMEGNGFLRHQVRRIVSVLIKVGTKKEGWTPEMIQQLLNGELDPRTLQGQSLVPARALWKTRVWLSEESHASNDSATKEEEEETVDDDEEEA